GSLCNRVVVWVRFAQMPRAALLGRPGIEAGWRLAHGPLQFGVGNGWGDGDRHRLGDLVLDGENVGEIPVIPVGRGVVAGFRLDQLRSDPNAIAGLAYTAFEHVTHAEFAPDLFHIDRTPLVRKGRVPAITN